MEKNINYSKIIKYLIEHEPHNIDAICEVFKNDTSITQEDILLNKKWSLEEKGKILQAYFDEMQNPNAKSIDKNLLKKIFKDDLFDEYMLLLRKFNTNISYNTMLNIIYGNHVENFKAKFTINDLAKTVKYAKPLLEIIPKSTIKNYFLFVIRTEDFGLIKECAPYVDNLEIYFKYVFMQTFNCSNVEMTKILIECGANPNHLPKGRGNDPLTPLEAAIRKNHFDIVKLLIENGADINLTRSPKNIPYYCKYDLMHFASPLTYASTIDGIAKFCGKHQIRFNTCPSENNYYRHDYIPLDYNNEELKERIKIIDYLFDNSNKNVDPTEFIKANLILHNYDNIHKYMDYFEKQHKPVNISAYTDLIQFSGFDYKNQEFVDLIVDILNKYNRNPQSAITKILNKSIEKAGGYLELGYFEKRLLEYLDEKHRKKIIIVPYVNTIKDLEYLLGLGFNINQTTEDGLNILMQQLSYYYEYEQNDNVDLFNYLTAINPKTNTSLIDLTNKDNEGNNALYYAIEYLKIDDSFVERGIFTEIGTRYEKKKITGAKPSPISNRERFIIDLFNLLPDKEINDPCVITASEGLFNYRGWNQYSIKTKYLLCHKELLLALRKHFTFSDELLKHILEDLYGKASSIDEISVYGDEHFVRCYGKLPIFSETLDFIYENLDKNCEIQKIDIRSKYGKYKEYLEKNDISFEQYLCMLKQIGMDVYELKKFKKEVIPKKIDPNLYMDYVKWKYNVTYDYFDEFALNFLLEGIHRFGTEKVDDMLAVIPNVDINKPMDIDLILTSDGKHYLNCYYSACIKAIRGLFMDDSTDMDDKYDEIYGTLIHFAILSNDLELVKKLKDNYARIFGFKNINPYKFIDKNNKEMKDYIDSQINTKAIDDVADDAEAVEELRHFNNSEIAYLKQLKQQTKKAQN